MMQPTINLNNNFAVFFAILFFVDNMLLTIRVHRNYIHHIVGPLL